MGSVQGYDLIGDVHGCGVTLCHLLEDMDYRKVNGVYQHPKGRKVVFIGDIVDRGPNIRLALNVVREMVEHGRAHLIMGNHEYNVLAFCTPSRPGSEHPYLREHTSRNSFIVEETMRQFDPYPQEWRDYLSWFLTLPLYEEFENFRAVHACWDHELISKMKGRYNRNTMDEEFLHASMDRESFEGRLVDRLTRGTALKLPDGRSITAKDGFVRHFFRTKFWEKTPEVYDDIVFQPDPLPQDIAEREITKADRKELLYYGPDEKPLFFGHYWMKGIPGPVTHNIACLDYSAVKYGRLVAYRMDDETRLDPNKFCWTRVERKED
jgi:hypothetical protein